MAARFLTDPDQMWAMASRFEMHAQRIAAEGRKMWASSQSNSDAVRSGTAEATSLDTTEQMHWAYGNIITMLRGVRDGLVRDANRYETEEQSARELLSGLRFPASLSLSA